MGSASKTAAKKKPPPQPDGKTDEKTDGKPEKKPRVTSPVSRSQLAANDDVEIDPEALEFIAALEKYKKIHGRPFPSWSEVLFVVKQLGYKKP